MKTNAKSFLSARRGSVLGATLIITLALALLLAGLLKWVDTERRITRQNLLLMKSRLAAAGVSEFGVAQIRARLAQVNYFPANEFSPGGPSTPVLPNATALESTPLSLVSNTLGGLLDLSGTSGGDSSGNGGGLLGGVVNGVGGLLGGLLGGGSGNSGHGSGNSGSGNSGSGSGSSGSGSSGSSSTAAAPSSSSESFRYEMSPQNLVVGKFSEPRPVIIDPSLPLYNGDEALGGMSVLVREVDMVSAAKVTDKSNGSERMAYCEQTLQVRDVPLAGYALFYNMDLEIAPGAAMEIYGPVHANGNIYVQSAAGLAFHGALTTAGDVRYGRAPGAESAGGASGAVTFKSSDTKQTAMLQDGKWIDSTATDWTTKASQLWNGNVRSRSHGINASNPAGIPDYVPDDPATSENELQNSAHALIDPSTPADASNYPGDAIEVQKYASKASIVLKVDSDGDVKAYKYTPNDSGDFVRKSASGAAARYDRVQLNVPSGVIVGGASVSGSRTKSFYDARRGKWIQNIDLDVGALKHAIEDDPSGWTKSGKTFDPATEWNGIVYVEGGNASNAGALRLVNGSSIPDLHSKDDSKVRGFTVATNLPAYIKGNYNADGNIPATGAEIREPDTENEPPASIAADAITILSDNWDDAKSNKDLGERAKPKDTEIAAAFLTGITPTNKNGNSTYSGGVENLPRLLEDWTNVKLGYRGSMIVQYESQIATEPWGSSNVYSAAKRIWGYNSVFAKGNFPPGTPYTRFYRRITYRDLDQATYAAEVARLSAP